MDVFSFIVEIPVSKQCVDPDPMPHSVSFDLGPHCFQMPPKWVSSLQTLRKSAPHQCSIRLVSFDNRIMIANFAVTQDFENF